jgi:hypothetical protein
VEYPFLFCVPQSILYDDNTTTYQLTFIFADILNYDLSNEKDCVSDMSLEARRFLSYLKRGLHTFPELYNNIDINLPTSAIPFFERFGDHVAGVALDCNLIVFEDLNACDYYPTVTPTSTVTATPNLTPTPTPSITPTITPTIPLFSPCTSFATFPSTINGITITESYTGAATPYIFSPPICCNGSVFPPSGGIYLGNGGVAPCPSPIYPFTYTLNFSSPVNNIDLVFYGGGCVGGVNEEFYTITTNTGNPTLTLQGNSCYTNFTGNTISAGIGCCGSISATAYGKFNINAPTPFTSLTISGDGGYLGSVVGLCADSIPPSNSPTPTPSQSSQSYYYTIQAVTNCATGSVSGTSYVAKSNTLLSTGVYVNVSTLVSANCAWKITGVGSAPEDDTITGSCGTSLPVSCCC